MKAVQQSAFHRSRRFLWRLCAQKILRGVRCTIAAHALYRPTSWAQSPSGIESPLVQRSLNPDSCNNSKQNSAKIATRLVPTRVAAAYLHATDRGRETDRHHTLSPTFGRRPLRRPYRFGSQENRPAAAPCIPTLEAVPKRRVQNLNRIWQRGRQQSPPVQASNFQNGQLNEP